VKFAISVDGDQVAAHFGRCERYELVDLEDGQITQRQQMANPGHEPGLLPRLLNEAGVECVVCGGAGPMAVGLLQQAGIQLIVGVSGPLEDIIGSIASGDLAAGESTCEH
jgi:predicted Fe-Mo cluster-binding NifX family protein